MQTIKQNAMHVYRDILMTNQDVTITQANEIMVMVKELAAVHTVDALVLRRMITYYDFDKVAKVLDLSPKLVKRVYLRAVRRFRSPNNHYRILGERPIIDGTNLFQIMNLSQRTRNALAYNGFKSLEQLDKYINGKSERFTYLERIGNYSLSEITELINHMRKHAKS